MLRRHEQLSFSGSIHFITTVTSIRGNWFVGEDICRPILESLEFCRAKENLDCIGYVLMPDHLHVSLCQGDVMFSVAKAIQDFKKFTSRKLRPPAYTGDTLWKKRYDDVPVPGSEATKTKLDYMHANPVRQGLGTEAEDYLWSSARSYSGTSESIVSLTPL